MTEKEELDTYRNFLISLHTARWTGNVQRFAKLMENLQAYSYSRTNSNFGNEKDEEVLQEQTLKSLNS